MYELKFCVWELTLACCFACKYCGSGGGRARPNELSTEECLNIVDQLSSIGCKRVSLIGGEVFMRDDWEIIAKELTLHKIRTSIITNGYQISDSLMDKINECRIESIAVSLDSTKDVHDQFRQRGSFNRAVAAISNVSAHGIPVSVISTLNTVSVRRLHEFYEFLQHLPIFAWQIQACSPMGNAQYYGMDYRFDFEEVLRFVGEKAGNAPFKIGVADNIGYLEIWDNPNAFSYNRQFVHEMLTGKCASCLHGRYCKAGCRSYNYFAHDKLYESSQCPCNDSVV